MCIKAQSKGWKTNFRMTKLREKTFHGVIDIGKENAVFLDLFREKMKVSRCRKQATHVLSKDSSLYSDLIIEEDPK